ncbi:MAG: T9SS type A sorting domain-containing protein [Candidatus Eisenbacteria bacterium]|uniref:T9SS type A sorting domain-containing protein n=1 Tax=Eiseniibacteriota bacterium TaxID=2212470 RepID=A0A956LZ90_UNCEI|nr:T9SS type A sorting domain-containing protein [Candidatus Eisenbacteria bacterium]
MASQRDIGFSAAIGIGVLLAGWCGTARGALPEYADFQLQVRSNIVDGFNLPAGSSFNSGTPALSDQGVATIRLLVVGGSGRAGLWYGGDGTGSVVYQAPVDRLLGDASINGAGQVVFEQSLDFQSEGVYRYDPSGGATVPAVPVGGPFGIEGFADPQINDAGEIGFRADRGSFQAYLRDVGGTQTQYATEGGGIAFLFVAQFNNASQLAGKVRLGSTAESQPDEIRRYEADGSFTRIAVDDDGDPGSPFVGFQNSVGIADNGWVAFVANLAQGSGVFASDGTTTLTIATSADPEVSSIDFFGPVINDRGWVAFRAFDESGLRAIFVGDGTDLRRVVTEHDLVPTDLGPGRIDQHDSSPVFGGSVDINAAGDVAFAAALTPAGNNQIEWGSGVFVAHAQDPAGVSESAFDVRSGVRVWPNPFRDVVRVAWRSGGDGTSLRWAGVHDVRGRLVRVLGNDADTNAPEDDRSTLAWDGTDESGRDVGAGVYFVTVRTDRGLAESKVLRVQ